MNTEETRKAVRKAILSGERELAGRLLDEYTGTGSCYRTMIEVLEPLLQDIGDNWAEEKLSLAQGFVAGKVAEDLLLKIHEADKGRAIAPEKGPVVLGNIEDDFHSFGRRLVSVFLQSAGWRVIDLGNDVAAEEFVDRAVEDGARIIGVSAMMYTTAENIRKVRNEIDRRNLSGKIRLAVGGAVFKLRPELVEDVGGDGTAANGFQAPALFDRLWEMSCKGEAAP